MLSAVAFIRKSRAKFTFYRVISSPSSNASRRLLAYFWYESQTILVVRELEESFVIVSCSTAIVFVICSPTGNVLNRSIVFDLCQAIIAAKPEVSRAHTHSIPKSEAISSFTRLLSRLLAAAVPYPIFDLDQTKQRRWWWWLLLIHPELFISMTTQYFR